MSKQPTAFDTLPAPYTEARGYDLLAWEESTPAEDCEAAVLAELAADCAHGRASG